MNNVQNMTSCGCHVMHCALRCCTSCGVLAQCRSHILLHTICLVCEVCIGVATILTAVFHQETSTANQKQIAFLALSLVSTLASFAGVHHGDWVCLLQVFIADVVLKSQRIMSLWPNQWPDQCGNQCGRIRSRPQGATWLFISVKPCMLAVNLIGFQTLFVYLKTNVRRQTLVKAPYMQTMDFQPSQAGTQIAGGTAANSHRRSRRVGSSVWSVLPWLSKKHSSVAPVDKSAADQTQATEQASEIEAA